nr:uncharacterized protein LOC131750354 [Kogia breviceps]
MDTTGSSCAAPASGLFLMQPPSLAVQAYNGETHHQALVPSIAPNLAEKEAREPSSPDSLLKSPPRALAALQRERCHSLYSAPQTDSVQRIKGVPAPDWRELQTVLREKLCSRSKSLRARVQPASRKSTTIPLTVCALEQTAEPSALSLLGPHVPSKCVSQCHRCQGKQYEHRFLAREDHRPGRFAGVREVGNRKEWEIVSRPEAAVSNILEVARTQLSLLTVPARLDLQASVVSKQREPRACRYANLWKEEASLFSWAEAWVSPLLLSPTFCLLHPEQRASLAPWNKSRSPG